MLFTKNTLEVLNQGWLQNLKTWNSIEKTWKFLEINRRSWFLFSFYVSAILFRKTLKVILLKVIESQKFLDVKTVYSSL